MPDTPRPEFYSLQQAVAGRYSLDRELGRGGMGVVFLARDVALDRLVAIKLLPPALAASRELRDRFIREARAAARLSHPNIVPIHSVEEHDELAFFVMGFVDGETLGSRVRRAGPLPTHEAMRVVQEIAWALAHAHANGIVHRDIKPDNVLLERGTGRVVVTDFGIAHLLDADTPRPGTVAGTPQYMSPEQGRGDPVDARSDIYSLGVSAFYALTGRLPFEEPSAMALVLKRSTEPAPSIASSRRGVPSRFATIVDRCLATSPGDRFASANDLAEELRAARTAAVDVAPIVRGFVRDADAAGSEIGTTLTAAATSLVVLNFGVTDDFFGIASAISFSISGIMTGLAGVRVGQLVLRARDLVREGFGHDAVRVALLLEQRKADDEGVALREETPRGRTLLVAASGAAASAAALWILNADAPAIPMWLGTVGAAGSIVFPTITVRYLWQRLRKGRSLWNRLVSGKLGEWIFRIARGGSAPMHRTAVVPGEPTALALGRAADELFAALPEDQRKRLSEVPAMIERLQADALALRARGSSGDSAMRIVSAIAALEALRLDLLRLHAGSATLDDLTRDLEAAREVGNRIAAELEGRREVARLVDPEPTPS